MASRRRAREIALQVLCALERQPELSPGQALTLYFRHLLADAGDGDADQSLDGSGAPGGDDGAPAERESKDASEERRFAEELVQGVRAHSGEIDALITRGSRNWRIERMSWVDRNLLRLASFELSQRPDVPARVVLNEAIEVAKRFGAAESPAFVNGVLDRVRSDLHRAD